MKTTIPFDASRVEQVLRVEVDTASEATAVHNATHAGSCLRSGVMPEPEDALDRKACVYSFGRDFSDEAPRRDVMLLMSTVHEANRRLDQQSNLFLKAATSEAWSVLSIARRLMIDERQASVVASKGAHEVLMAAGAVRLPYAEAV